MSAPWLAGARLRALALLVIALLPACAEIAEPQQSPEILLRLEALAVRNEALFSAIDAAPRADRSGRYARLDADAALLATLAKTRATTPGVVVVVSDSMADYRRNLALLQARDAPPSGPHPAWLALRRAAMMDALNDALFYEKTVLDRRR